MPEFPVSTDIKTEVPTVEVTVNPAKPLPVGTQTFRLVVTDDTGNVSKPAEVRILVVDDVAPTAVLTAPGRVGFGKSFTLDGTKSIDIGGKIVSYVWTYVGPTGSIPL